MNPHSMTGKDVVDAVKCHHNSIAARVLNLSFQLGYEGKGISSHAFNGLLSLAKRVSEPVFRQVQSEWRVCEDGEYRMIQPAHNFYPEVQP